MFNRISRIISIMWAIIGCVISCGLVVGACQTVESAVTQSPPPKLAKCEEVAAQLRAEETAGGRAPVGYDKTPLGELAIFANPVTQSDIHAYFLAWDVGAADALLQRGWTKYGDCAASDGTVSRIMLRVVDPPTEASAPVKGDGA